MKKMCERCFEEYDEGEIYPSSYFKNLFCTPCEREYENKLVNFRIAFFNNQPKRSKREDPHLNLEDIENMTVDQMKTKMMEMEHIIFRQSCWICSKCVGCGALNSMET